MEVNALGVFFSAFLGGMLLYMFRVAVTYRNDPENFVWAGWGDLCAQFAITLTVTLITFLSLYKAIETGPAECGLMVSPYIKACTEAMMLEMLIHMIREPNAPAR